MRDVFLAVISCLSCWAWGYFVARLQATKRLTFARKEAQRMNAEPRLGNPFFRYGRNHYIVGYCDGAMACATGKTQPPIEGLAELEKES